MKTDIHKLDDGVLQDILNNCDYDEVGPERQKAIESSLANSSPHELMDRFLNWNGIIGYTEMIMKAQKSIEAAQVDNPLEKVIKYMWDDEYLSYQKENGLGDDDDVITHALNNKDQEHIFCALARLHVND